jgi:opacity protein-like surface antigen
MRKLGTGVLVLLAFSISVSAQDKTPTVDVFGGYSYLNFKVKLGFDPTFDVDRQSASGLGINVAVNLTKGLGIVGDGSYNTKGVRIPAIFGPNTINVRHTYFLFGPRLSFRRDKATAFVEGLAGGAHIRDEFGHIHSTTDLAFAIGGGLDLNVSKRLAVRAVQLDYLPSRRRLSSNTDKEWLQNFRVQFGVVFKFGGQ